MRQPCWRAGETAKLGEQRRIALTNFLVTPAHRVRRFSSLTSRCRGAAHALGKQPCSSDCKPTRGLAGLHHQSLLSSPRVPFLHNPRPYLTVSHRLLSCGPPSPCAWSLESARDDVSSSPTERRHFFTPYVPVPISPVSPYASPPCCVPGDCTGLPLWAACSFWLERQQ